MVILFTCQDGQPEGNSPQAANASGSMPGLDWKWRTVQAVPLCKALTEEAGKISLSQYTAVDTSRAALDLAEHNVRHAVGPDCTLFCHESDMLSFLRSSASQKTYDVGDVHMGSWVVAEAVWKSQKPSAKYSRLFLSLCAHENFN